MPMHCIIGGYKHHKIFPLDFNDYIAKHNLREKVHLIFTKQEGDKKRVYKIRNINKSNLIIITLKFTHVLKEAMVLSL
ncbi:hypothetical protein AT239_05270 [Bartonella henselae]|nr:hypothetical protein AT247_02620 [Bartonella henselae]OLL48247.1 hypothetical protein AT241_03800 [Bartonella henselae]OLL51861.1 hypothetical protein AT243_06355 [Bartonella henselae]OLL56146.1 hypothetical protein AT239_05270 [Bartonella henselae]OLL56689.1 hypothetical protein AT240_04745 [Bartonella henselae]